MIFLCRSRSTTCWAAYLPRQSKRYSRKLVRHRSIKLNFRHLRQALFELTVKRVNSFFDRLLPNFLMKLECTIRDQRCSKE